MPFTETPWLYVHDPYDAYRGHVVSLVEDSLSNCNCIFLKACLRPPDEIWSAFSTPPKDFAIQLRGLPKALDRRSHIFSV